MIFNIITKNVFYNLKNKSTNTKKIEPDIKATAKVSDNPIYLCFNGNGCEFGKLLVFIDQIKVSDWKLEI